MNISNLRCTLCGATYKHGEVEYTCPACGIDGILDVEYDYEEAKKELNKESLANNDNRSIWRYLPILPIPDGAELPRLRVGWTPIYDAPVLAEKLGLSRLRIKDEGVASTGSFKDRASSVGVVRAKALGFEEIACASTGNAASSLAGFSADMGLKARIFVPESAPVAKVSQLLIYGAQVFLVEDNYDRTWELCQAAVEDIGWYNRNCAVNPYLVEGKKTGGLEIGEQTADDPPDWVALSVGDGCTIAGVGKGLKEMNILGVSSKVPRLLGVQSEKAAPLVDSMDRGVEELKPVDAASLADSINVGTPRNWRKALRAVRESNGAIISVTDEAILEAIPTMARASGVFGEPAASAALAGVIKACETGLIKKGESVVVISSGSGLKDSKNALKAVERPKSIACNLEEVRRAISLAK
ncbi:threonine synthase [Myxococcota bacterium]|nr:threonine synthase [Myxococcota bacterium]